MKKIMTSLAVSIALATAPLSFAADEEVLFPPFESKDTDIREFINMVGDFTGKSMIISNKINGKINLNSRTSLTKEGLFDFLQLQLQMLQYTAHDNGTVVRVLPASEVKQLDSTVELNGVDNSQNIETSIIEIKNLPAAELVPILRPFAARYGQVSVITSTNSIIIVDHAANIERLQKIIKLMDEAGDLSTQVIEIKAAWVGDLIPLIQTLLPETLGQGNNSSTKLKIVADERSNRLIVRGSKKDILKVMTLVQELDTASTQTSSSTVIFLNNADAKKMQATLQGIAGVVEQEAAGGAPKSNFAILADEDLNALIIRAEPAMLAEIKAIINQLDKPRAQVLIEAIIVEVRGNEGDKLGVQWLTNPASSVGGYAVPATLSQFESAGTSLGAIANAAISGSATTAVNAVDSGFTAGITDSATNPHFGALITALASQNNTNLLSTPSIMTLDNSEASLLVGGTQPFQSTTSAGGDGNPFTTVTREDVGTTLKVIPHIQNNDVIRLEVEQKVESVSPEQTNGSLGTSTDKREIKTQVLVKNGETIILGGLMKDEASQSVSKIPLLGDIPFLGFLFRSTITVHEKVNLLVFIKPTIIRNDAQDFSEKRYNRIWELSIDGNDFDPLLKQPEFNELTIH
jgi:general secretion pathway protein D